MAIITSYSTLQSELKAELHRTDDTASPWTRFIDQAESRLLRDRRVRKHTKTTLSTTAESVALTSDFKELVSLAHDGSTYYGHIEIVDFDVLPTYKRKFGTPGPPIAAALSDRQTIQFAPVPDQTYTLDLTYYAGFSRLGGAVLSNWLLDDHPDIYLQACLIEAANFFEMPEKKQQAYEELDRRLEELHRDTERGRYGGALTRLPARAIG